MRAEDLTGTGAIQDDAQEFSYVVRSVSLDEVPQIHELHREILQTLSSPLMLYERSADFFAECVGGRGCVTGAFTEGRLIGYAAGWAPGADTDNYGRDIGLDTRDLGHVAHLAGSCIHPRYRGNRLHTHVVELRAEMLHLADYYHQCGVVVPDNVRSIRNHLASGYFLEGFRIDDFRFDAEGAPHFILHRDTRSEPRRIDEPEAPEAPIGDIDTYRRMLETGLWGYRIRDIEGETLLCYGRFEQ